MHRGVRERSSGGARARRIGAFGALAIAGLCGCRDNATRFTTHDDHFEGSIVTGRFVRSNLGDDVRMCVLLDGERLQDTPGTLTTSDGRFRGTPLRPIPQIWHDPLSTLTFGDGRARNLVYVATPAGAGADAEDAFVFVSLMENGEVEVRLLRGAPTGTAEAGAPPRTPPLFGVFTLDRREGACSF